MRLLIIIKYTFLYLLFLLLFFTKGINAGEIYHFGQVANLPAPKGYCDISNDYEGKVVLDITNRAMQGYPDAPIPKLVFKKCGAKKYWPQIMVMISKQEVPIYDTQEYINEGFSKMLDGLDIDDLFEDDLNDLMTENLGVNIKISSGEKLILYSGKEAFITIGAVNVNFENKLTKLMSISASVIKHPFFISIYLQDKYEDKFDGKINLETLNLIESIRKMKDMN